MSIDSTNNGDESRIPDEATNKYVEIMAEAESGESSKILSKTMPESQPEPISTEEVKPPSKKLCGVCNENEGKYKCSRCYLPYCSVTCSKQHKINHPPDVPKPSSFPTPVQASESNGRYQPGTKSASSFKGPFHALSLSPDLKTLFKTYPNLPSVLEKINSATLPPISDYTPSGLPTSSKTGQGQPWTSDKGIAKGIEALRMARNEDGVDAESVREYGRVVLAVLAGEEGEMRTEEIVRREMEKENARIVEMLLNGDIG